MNYATQTNIRILSGEDLLRSLRNDIEAETEVYLWSYLFTREWYDELIWRANKTMKMWMIVDARTRQLAAEMHRDHPTCHAWCWPQNRTMHDKTMVLTRRAATYIGTQNNTRGSYYLSENRAVRIDSEEVATRMIEEWRTDTRRCQKVTRAHAGKEEKRCE